MSAAPLLSVRNLRVRFSTPDGEVEAVRGIDFDVAAGETLGIVGESGSGKSQTVLALLGLLADNGQASGQARFGDRDLLALPEAELAAIRGSGISVVFQDPMTALNPYLSIGEQLGLVLRHKQGLGRREARARAADALESVHISEPQRRLAMYPHELSGGMRQRVMLAAALACEPALLIADEPTTALDVTVQAQILALLAELTRAHGTALILITHDLGVVAGSCDRVLVMERGEARDYAPVERLFARPGHAYTRALLDAVPRIDRAAQRPPPAGEILLQAQDLQVEFPVRPEGLFARPRRLKAVAGVDLSLRAGETVGVVGESGCGKSTLARAVLRLLRPTAGRIVMLGKALQELDGEPLRRFRRHLQVVFQDPLAALDPRMTVRDIVAEPLQNFEPSLNPAAVTERVAAMLERVGLEPAHLNRYPHQFSGGQCQRIGIARALIIRPELVICDEPVSALDVTVQAQIVRLLTELQDELGLALMFIAHDLAVVRQLSHRVMVMYLGRAVEVAEVRSLYEQPRHPYTRALLDAVPVPDPVVERTRQRVLLSGELPSPLSPPSGCAFRGRCPLAQARCAEERPALRPAGASLVACHFADEA
ncbi:MAG: oligopeptide ABC transporter ATP-binding protein OppD [Gammaproteobacteria bacterium]|nr:MAG: oligopeptide ABC transporter ATP-binding protein OppD [Gammaproteobacteria bacterium]